MAATGADVSLTAVKRSSLLAPFAIRSFRFQWPADLLTSCAFEMEALILAWYILVETGSVLMLTVFGALQYPGTLIAPMFGVVGDRITHRNLICGMRAVYAALAVTLMTLALAGILTPTLVLIIAGLSGLVRPSDLAMRSALVAETMPADQLMSAVGISRTTSDAARIGGAIAGAGLFAALGMGSAYIAIASCYLVGLGLSFGIARAPLAPGSTVDVAGRRASPWRELNEGIVYVVTTPYLLGAMLLAFLINLTAFPLCIGLLPYVVREIYQTDQTGLGYLIASFGFGSLLGAVALSPLSSGIRPARMMIVFAAIWYALLLLFAQIDNELGGAVVLVLAGFAQSLSLVPLSVMLLRTSSEKFRGRVMGMRMLAVLGLPLGLLAAGALIDRVGYNATATAYCAVGIVFTLLIAVRWRAELWQLQAPANAR
jgi:predicted MFS family arabinose efflux permease